MNERPIHIQRLSMRRIKEVFCLKHVQGLSERIIAHTLGNGAVHSYLRQTGAAGLNCPLPAGMTDEDPELLLFPAPRPASQNPQRRRHRPLKWGSAVDEAVRRGNGRSSYTYAEALPKRAARRLDPGSHQLFAFLRGAPTFVVCDNLKAAVTNPDRHDPALNRTMPRWRAITAPPFSQPGRDAQSIRQRSKLQRKSPSDGFWRGCATNQRFFSLAELNTAIKILVVELNARQMRDFGASRAELYAELDKRKLTKLPDPASAFARWKRCRVGPYRLIRELVDARIDDRTVEIFHNDRIASHARAPNRRGHSTITDHMPSAHRHYGQWAPARVIADGERSVRRPLPCSRALIAGADRKMIRYRSSPRRTRLYAADCAISPTSGGVSATAGCSSCCGERESHRGSTQRYREEGLTVRKRRTGRKAVGARAPIVVEARPNAR